MKFSDIELTDIGNTIQMVGAVYADSDGKGYYFPFPSTNGEGANPEHVEMTNEDWKALLRQADLVEVEATVEAEDGTLQKAIVRKSQRQIDAQVSFNVWRRDNFMCRYCGTEKLALTVDHLVRYEDGGPSIEANLVACCRRCNKVRGNTAYAAWLRHPYYLEKSQSVSVAYQELNRRVADTLASIPRVYIKKGR
jgi:5-methylcytosine-specific restriction endonuclease McrA